MLETVAGASPDTRASSAWVYGSGPRSRSRTRRWFAVRSDEGEPGARGASESEGMAEL